MERMAEWKLSKRTYIAEMDGVKGTDRSNRYKLEAVKKLFINGVCSLRRVKGE